MKKLIFFSLFDAKTVFCGCDKLVWFLREKLRPLRERREKYIYMYIEAITRCCRHILHGC